MSTETAKIAVKKPSLHSDKISSLLGEIFSFNSSLKLAHWHVTGKGSYAAHMALDEAIGSLLEVTDRLVETSYGHAYDLEITVPETSTPKEIIPHVEEFYSNLEKNRSLFSETFTQAILDDYQEALKQLLYRLKRLQ